MTLAVLPPDYEELGVPPSDKPVPLPDFAGLVDHFHALVEMTEAHRQLEQLG